MSLQLVLNAVWGLVALVAVLVFALAERRHLCVQTDGRRTQRMCAVLLAVCLLFPCVSASDDILGLSMLQFGHGSSTPAPDKNLAHLERVLQELENVQLSAAFILVFVLCCVGLIIASRVQTTARQLPCVVGRGPPVVA